MSRWLNLCVVLCGFVMAAGSAGAQRVEWSGSEPIHLLTPVLSDPLMQHSKETYVLYGCAYCHGVDLRVRNGDASDLIQSKIVAADENANAIGYILRTGIPQTAALSPMPKFADLSDKEISDIARYIHYGRQQARFKDLTEATLPPGNAAAGKSYFGTTCASCHSQSDIAQIAKKYDAPALKAQVLHPAFLDKTPSLNVAQRDAKLEAARQRHGKLLENYSPEEVANLLAYVQTLK